MSDAMQRAKAVYEAASKAVDDDNFYSMSNPAYTAREHMPKLLTALRDLIAARQPVLDADVAAQIKRMRATAVNYRETSHNKAAHDIDDAADTFERLAAEKARLAAQVAQHEAARVEIEQLAKFYYGERSAGLYEALAILARPAAQHLPPAAPAESDSRKHIVADGADGEAV